MRRAVVLGGSIAGLLAARVLSDHADEVVIVDRDDLSVDEGGFRTGAPQGRHLHVLLDMGRTQLDRWFPGLSDQLLADGAELAPGQTIRHYVDGAAKVTAPNIEMICVTRPFLETRVRRRVLSRSNIRLVRGVARGFALSRGKVRAARFLPTGSHTSDSPTNDSTTEVSIDADAVVDATGRGTRLGDWLRDNELPVPTMERMAVDLGYATAEFRGDADLSGIKVVHSLRSMPSGLTDLAAFARVDGDRLLVVLGGYAGAKPTSDPIEFIRRCRESPVRVLGDLVDGCEMTSPPTTYRYADARRRNFHSLDRWPVGLYVAGDAVASFNPIYGQGMTAATLHASCLSAHLRAAESQSGTTESTAPPSDYFRRVQVVVDAAWQFSTLPDLALPHLVDQRPRGYRFARSVSDLILRASITDAKTNGLFQEVLHMRQRPNVLTTPPALLRAAWTNTHRSTIPID